MLTKLIENNWSKIIAIFLMAMLIPILVGANALWHQPDGWLIGDWLINYQGGFVRRGLPGEIFLKISSFTKIDLVTLIVMAQISLCLCTFVFTFELAKRIKPTVTNVLILFSPAFIQFMSLGSDGLRKDMLLFALLSYHSYRLSRSNDEIGKGYLTFLSFSFVVLVLSNEMMLAFLPYFIGGLYLNNNQLNFARLRTYLIVLVPATLAAGAVILLFRGNSEIVSGICNSLAHIPLYDCQPHKTIVGDRPIPAAIGFLALNLSDGIWAVAYCNPPKSLILSGIVLVLATTPIFYCFSKNKILKSDRYLTVFLLASFVATLPLLLVFADYGRLISIHAICLTYVTLQILNRHERVDTASYRSGSLVWIFCLIYILGWKIVAFNPSPSQVFPVLKIYKEVKTEISLNRDHAKIE